MSRAQQYVERYGRVQSRLMLMHESVSGKVWCVMSEIVAFVAHALIVVCCCIFLFHYVCMMMTFVKVADELHQLQQEVGPAVVPEDDLEL